MAEDEPQTPGGWKVRAAESRAVPIKELVEVERFSRWLDKCHRLGVPETGEAHEALMDRVQGVLRKKEKYLPERAGNTDLEQLTMALLSLELIRDEGVGGKEARLRRAAEVSVRSEGVHQKRVYRNDDAFWLALIIELDKIPSNVIQPPPNAEATTEEENVEGEDAGAKEAEGETPRTEPSPHSSGSVAATTSTSALKVKNLYIGPYTSIQYEQQDDGNVSDEGPANTKVKSFRWTRRATAVLCAFVLLVVAGIAGIGFSISTSTAAANTPSDQVEIENIDTKLNLYNNATYWVPLSAPLKTLPTDPGVSQNYGYCQDPTLQRWLTKYGVLQQVTHEFTIRDQSGSTTPIVLTDVVAHKSSTVKDEPGFLFHCPTGGGDLNWDLLQMNLQDGQVATVEQKQAPDNVYFRNITQNHAAGIDLDLRATGDFGGYVTLQLAQGKNHSTVKLPVNASNKANPYTVAWHTVPDDKYLRVEPGWSAGEQYRCFTTQPNGVLDAGTPCAVSEIQARLAAQWGKSE